jgi:hypothetical protein
MIDLSGRVAVITGGGGLAEQRRAPSPRLAPPSSSGILIYA